MPASSFTSSSTAGGGGGGRGSGSRRIMPKSKSGVQLTRSHSATTHKPHETMRHMARRVPFFALPGMGSELGSFVRSYSRANLARLNAATMAGMGTMGTMGTMGMGGIPSASAPPPATYQSLTGPWTTTSGGGMYKQSLSGGLTPQSAHGAHPSYGSVSVYDREHEPILTSPPSVLAIDTREVHGPSDESGGGVGVGGHGVPFSTSFGEGSFFGATFDEDEEEELEMMQPGFTLALGMAVFTAVLASFQVGYNSGVLNVPQSIIVSQLHLSTIEWSVAVAIFCIGGLIGSMAGGILADEIGRKNFFMTNNGCFIGGGLLQALASGCISLSLGRLLIGIGCGGATVVVPMYLGEISPANLRGSLGTMNQFSMVIGILIANLLGKPLGGADHWRYLLGLAILPALIQILLSAALMESPLWLLVQGGAKNRSHAEEVLSKLRGTDDVAFDIECMIASTMDDDDDAEADDDEEEGEEESETWDEKGDVEAANGHRRRSSEGHDDKGTQQRSFTDAGAHHHSHKHSHSSATSSHRHRPSADDAFAELSSDSPSDSYQQSPTLQPPPTSASASSSSSTSGHTHAAHPTSVDNGWEVTPAGRGRGQDTNTSNNDPREYADEDEATLAHHSYQRDIHGRSRSSSGAEGYVYVNGPGGEDGEEGDRMLSKSNGHSSSSSSKSMWLPQYRRPLLVGFGLQLVQQFSGINAVFFYSTAFFASAHLSDPWLGSVLASFVNVIATGLSIYLIERTGRRPLLLVSTFGMMLSCVGLTWVLQYMQQLTQAAAGTATAGAADAAASTAAQAVSSAVPSWVGSLSVVMILIFVSFFEIGLGPIPWLIGAEIFPSPIRSRAMGVSSTINWLSNFMVGLSFPSVSAWLGPLSFLPFGIVLAVAFILEWKFVPETQGKSLEEIQRVFQREVEGEGEGEDEDEGEFDVFDECDDEATALHSSSQASANERKPSDDFLSGSEQEDEAEGEDEDAGGRLTHHRNGSEATPIPEEDEESQSPAAAIDASRNGQSQRQV